MPTCESAPLTPDEALAHRIVDHLAESHRPSLKRLVVEVKSGMVHLRGCVRSFYEKQLAIHSCIQAAGAGRLVDRVEVVTS